MARGTRYSAIHAALVEALELVELRQSVFDFDRFGRDAASHVHDTFAIAMNDDEDEIHQRRGTPRLIRGTLRVRVAHRIRADNQVADRLSAHTQAEDACNALLQNADRAAGFHLWASSRSRSTPEDGSHLFTELVFQLQYQHHTEED